MNQNDPDMNTLNPSPESSAPDDVEKSLRQRAEESARAKADLTPEAIAALGLNEVEQMLHELRVHQIELEMQNTELRQTQVALEESRARYFDLYDLAPVGYFTISQNGIIEQANLTAAVLLGVTREALVKRPFTHFILPADQSIYYFQNKQLIDYGKTKLFELRLSRADGSHLWVSIKAIKVADEPGTRLIINDITERKESEQALQTSYQSLETALAQLQSTQDQLIQQERLAAVGQMAAGIAHDFNNILAVIILQTQLGQKTNDLLKLQAKLKIILQQSQDAAALVQQILDFGGRTIIQPKPLNLASFLKENIALLRLTIPKNIQINLDTPSNPCFILADHHRFRQLFTNLALNGRDAMPNGGQIFISVKQHQATDNSQPIDLSAGNWVKISVIDTGIGIEPDSLSHIFEPFFTTKSPGKGTGLGLAQVYGIVKQHKGFIDVHSISGQGTTFNIYFPELITPLESAIVKHSPSDKKLQSGHGEVVLLVEDNTVLREVLVSILEEMNYKTKTASNGEEALRILQASPKEVALVLSDLIMPCMGGEALFRAIRQEGLTTPVIMMSGQPLEPAFIQTLLNDGLAGYLTKPPKLDNLAFLLAQALP